MSRIQIVAVLLVAAMTGGCVEHFASIDRHTFKSTPLLPTTITLVDTTTKEPFWTYDIPPCYRLRLDFNRHPEVEGAFINTEPASKLKWWLQANDSLKVIEKGECDLSGCRPFIMKVTYRPAPEYPDTDAGILPNCPDCPVIQAPARSTRELTDGSPATPAAPGSRDSRTAAATPAPQAPAAPPAPAVAVQAYDAGEPITVQAYPAPQTNFNADQRAGIPAPPLTVEPLQPGEITNPPYAGPHSTAW